MAVVRLQGRGQITLPSKFRKSVGLEPGDALLVRQLGPGHFEVHRLFHRSLLDFDRADVQVDMQAIREDMGELLSARFTPEALRRALAEAAATQDG